MKECGNIIGDFNERKTRRLSYNDELHCYTLIEVSIGDIAFLSLTLIFVNIPLVYILMHSYPRSTSSSSSQFTVVRT